MVFKHHGTEVKLLALTALDNGASIPEVEACFQVSARSLARWQEQLESTFTLARRNSDMVGRPRAIPPALLHVLNELIDESPSLYLDEIADYFSVMHGEFPPLSTLSKAILDLGLDRKVLRKIAAQRDDGLRTEWMHWVNANISAEQMVFTDESSKDGRTMARGYGRARSGQRAEEYFNHDRGTRWSILPALALDGYLTVRIVEGSVDGEEFFDFIINELLPKMNPYPAEKSVLIMDNCRIHKSEAVQQACEDQGVLLIFLPAYSPDFNPIEESFSCLKSYLRRHWREFEYSDDPEADLEAACYNAVSADNAPGWFRHSGYLY